MKERNPEIRKPEPSMPLFEQSFAKFEQAHARRNDPATSHAAARSVVNLGSTREGILKILRLFGPCTDEKIELMYRGLQERGEFPMRKDSGIRSRRKELCDMGFVEAAGGFNEDGTTWGITGKTASKRNCLVWRIRK
jgi:hypothetical protein